MKIEERSTYDPRAVRRAKPAPLTPRSKRDRLREFKEESELKLEIIRKQEIIRALEEYGDPREYPIAFDEVRERILVAMAFVEETLAKAPDKIKSVAFGALLRAKYTGKA